MLLAVLVFLRSSPTPSTAPASTSTAHATDALPAPRPAPNSAPKALKAVDPADVERRYDAAGRERFSKMPTDRQADEMAEIFRDEARALDRSREEMLRVRAFQKLAARGALSREAATAMAELLQNSPQPLARTELSQASNGHLNDRPELVEALLARLQSDPHEMVRKRAAQALSDRRDDPRVRSALDQALTTDASFFVRDAVRLALQEQATR